jgi:arylsulfatase A-like enzyme
VIVLITDDQGYGDLACHGNRVIRTPNLDRLHARSVRLAVGRAEQAKPIPRGAAAVTFTVGLKAGETRVQTWLTDEQSGESRGAYYVYVRPAG